MKFVIMFFIVSLVLCAIVNVGAFVAEKVHKKNVEKMVKDIKE